MNRIIDDEEYEQQQNHNLSDDDNAQFDGGDDDGGLLLGGDGTAGGGGGGAAGGTTTTGEGEDPLLLALDDLEGRIVNELDQFKLHPGIQTNDDYTTVHDELAVLLRPVVEVAAHTGPSVARTYFRGSVGSSMEYYGGLEEAVENVYERLVSDLTLPVLLEVAQSDPIAAKRGAAIEFFRLFFKEIQKAGSWLDTTAATSSPMTGPYGSGGSSSSSSSSSSRKGGGSGGGGEGSLPRMVTNRRTDKRLAREGECLRYWISATNACLTPGVFTDQNADTDTTGRGILAASVSLRPALRHIVQRIKTADDRGASRLYTPVMKMIEGVLNKLLLHSGNSQQQQQQQSQPPENTLAACIKFLEIVLLCCSRKEPESSTSSSSSSSSRRGRNSTVSTKYNTKNLSSRSLFFIFGAARLHTVVCLVFSLSPFLPLSLPHPLTRMFHLSLSCLDFIVTAIYRRLFLVGFTRRSSCYYP
jgi:symplekin